MENDDTFKLTLRQWLVRMIDGQVIPGLEWLQPPQRTYFKIPWNRQGHCENFENEYQLFIEWAKHRGSYDEQAPPNWPKLKSNFRSVISKSNDFEETKDYHVLKKQTGNYKVYRLLSPSEVKAKASQRKKKSCDDMENAHHSSQDSQLLQASTYYYQSETISGSQPQNDLTGSDGDCLTVDVAAIKQSCAAFSKTAPDSQCLTLELQPIPMEFHQEKPSPNLISASSSEQEAMEVDTARDSDATGLLLRNDQASALLSPNVVDISSERVSGIIDSHIRENPERFFYKLTVRYRGAAQSIQQLRDGLIDMDHAAEKRTWPSHAQDHNGFRLLYGSDSEQFISLVTKRSVPEEFNLPPLTLPRPEEEDPQVLKVLSNMIQGVVFSTDQEGNLHARRLCKSRAFYLRGDSVVCMDRRQTYTIFSYRTYVDALFRSKIQSKLRPLREVSLYFGARPKDVKSHGLVTVTMEPQIIQPIHAMFDGGEGSLVGSSKSDSIDMLLRETGSASPADSLLRQQQASLKQ